MVLASFRVSSDDMLVSSFDSLMVHSDCSVVMIYEVVLRPLWVYDEGQVPFVHNTNCKTVSLVGLMPHSERLASSAQIQEINENYGDHRRR